MKIILIIFYDINFTSLLLYQNENKSNYIIKMIYLSINKFYNVYFNFDYGTNCILLYNLLLKCLVLKKYFIFYGY